MANHKSSEKRIRNSESKNERNHYQAKTTRNVIKKLRLTKDATEAKKLLPEVSSMLDKLAKRNIIHKNKAANLKSGLTKIVAGLK
jgi:small subunit ribosomal protein S20